MASGNPELEAGISGSIVSVEGNRRGSFFARYAKLFRQATGLELNLLQSRGQDVAVLWGSTRNPFCRAILSSTPLQGPCRHALLQAAKDVHTNGRIDLPCSAGLTVTVLPLAGVQVPGLFLLAGRVITGDINRRSQAFALKKLKKLHPARKANEWAELACRIQSVPLQKYEAAIDMLTLLLAGLTALIEEDLLAEIPQDSASVNKARDFILSNFTADVSLADIAHACSLSEDYLSHHFKQTTGRGVARFIGSLRVERAACLLVQQPSQTITEICFAAGFQSISQFNRTFCTATGMSPREYRNSSLSGDHSTCTRTRQK